MYTLKGHTDSVVHGDISPDARLILSCSMDSTVRLWGVETGACYRVYRGHTPRSWVKVVKFLPGGAGFVSAGLDRKVVVWGLRAQDTSPLRTIDAHDDYILDLAVLPQSATEKSDQHGAHISEALGGGDAAGHGGEHDDGGLKKTMRSADQVKNLVLTVSKDRTQRLWDANTGGCRRTIKSKLPSWSCTVAFSDDGKVFACGSPVMILQRTSLD